MSTIINVECVDQDLFITNSPTLASGGICENIVSFKFCNKWNGFSKTAVFYQNEKNVFYALINSQNECEIPYEVTLNEGTLYMGVFGVDGDTRRTSKIDKIRIHKGAWTSDMHPSDPTPDIYTQILASYNEIIENQDSFINSQNQLMKEYHDAWLQTVETTRSEMIAEVEELVERAEVLDAETWNGWQIFKSRTEINESFNDNTTIEEIVKAMPAYSRLVANVYAGNADVYPQGNGILTIEKGIIGGYTNVTFKGMGNKKLWIGIAQHNTNDTITWSGWGLTSDGGNADTVDGYHANNLQRYKDFGDTETDCNTVVTNGMYKCRNWLNYPPDHPDDQGILEVINFGHGNGEFNATIGNGLMWLRQIFYSPHDNRAWERYVSGTTVTDWKPIGIGAFLPLTGGKVNGKVEISIDNAYSARYFGGSAGAYMETFAKDSENNKRQLFLGNKNGRSDIKYALQLVDYNDGATSIYTVLHTGNSQKVTITADKNTPPSTMEGLWAY